MVVGGASLSTRNSKFAVARYNTDGTLDTTFSGDGRVITDLSRRYDVATGVAIQADGKIVVAGGQNGATAWGANFAVVRYDADGTLDTTFSGDGRTSTDFSGRSFDFGQGGVQLQGDGKIVVGGDSQPYGSSNARFALARYNTDGSLDTTFSGDGKLTTDFTTSGPDGEFGVAVQADGKMVGAGEAGGANPEFAVVRYNTDGSLDTTFSGDGKTFTDFTGKWDFAAFILIQADGNIVAVGASGGIDPKFALARYLAA